MKKKIMSFFLSFMKLPDVRLVLQAHAHIAKVNITRYISRHKGICLGGIHGELSPEIHKNRSKTIKQIESRVYI